MTKNALSSKTANVPGVYRIKCKDCDNCYYGETGRNIVTRIREHKRDIRMNKLESGIASHVNNLDHNFNFSEAKVIFPCNDKFKRHIVCLLYTSPSPRD